MTSAAATNLAQVSYPGASKPLSRSTGRDDVANLAWWTASAKTEGMRTPRHEAAFGLYIDLGLQAQPSLPADCFPALLEFLDGVRMRPDKGFIKAALGAEYLIGQDLSGELVFELTPAGRDWLRSGC